METRATLNIPRHLRHRLKCLAVKREETMYDTIAFCLDLEEAVQHLCNTLEAVLDLDWEYTKEHILQEDRIPEGKTFLYPGTDVAMDNWNNYATLLSQYYALRLRLLDGKAIADAPSMA